MSSSWRSSRRSVLQGLAAAGALAQVSLLQATEERDDAARLRALIDASDAAAERLEPLPRNPRARAAGEPVFVDPLAESTADAQLANLKRDWAALQDIRVARLPPVERIAYDVFAYRTRRDLDRHQSGVARIQRLAPLDASFGLHLEFPDYVSGAGAPFGDTTDYEIGLERLRGFSLHLDALTARLREGLAAGYRQPEVVVRKVIAQAEAMLAQPLAESPFLAAVRRLPPAFDAATRERFERAYTAGVQRDVLPAYARCANTCSATICRGRRVSPAGMGCATVSASTRPSWRTTPHCRRMPRAHMQPVSTRWPAFARTWRKCGAICASPVRCLRSSSSSAPTRSSISPSPKT
jgi:uncharacterized protein (DUF885 family)